MDTDAFHSALLSVTVVSEKIRAAREALSTADLPTVNALLAEAENDLRIGKATLAGELGFTLCPTCWPPEIVATDRDGRVTCPACGQISYDEAA